MSKQSGLSWWEQLVLATLIYVVVFATLVSAALQVQSEEASRLTPMEDVGSPPPEPPEWERPVITGASVVTLDVGHDRNLPLLF